MTASLDDKYRLITIDIKNANAQVPTIRLAGGDIAGRVINVTGWPSGYTPRIAYNPNPDGSASGGYIEAARAGIDSATYGYAYFELPRGIFKSTHAVLAFELLDGRDTVISSRRIPVIVEPPVVNADGGEAYDGLSDLHNAVTIAKDAASKATTAESTFNQAVRDGKAAMNGAISDFNTKGDKAISANTDRVTALIDGASIDATSHEVTPATAPSVTKTGTGTQATFDFGLPRAPHVAATAESTDANAAAVSTSTDSTGDITLNFTLPRARNISATAMAGTEAAVSQTADANGDVMLAFTLPRGEKGEKGDTGPQGPAGGPKGDKGEKGDKGDPGESTPIATAATAGKVKPGNGLGVESDGTLLNMLLSGRHFYIGSYQMPLGAKNGFKSELTPAPTDDDPPKIGDFVLLPDERIGVINYVDKTNPNEYYGIGSYYNLIPEEPHLAQIESIEFTPADSDSSDGCSFSGAAILCEGLRLGTTLLEWTIPVAFPDASAENHASKYHVSNMILRFASAADCEFAASLAATCSLYASDGSCRYTCSLEALNKTRLKVNFTGTTSGTPPLDFTDKTSVIDVMLHLNSTSSTSTQAAEIEKSAASLQTLGYDEPAITARLADTGYTVSFNNGKPTATPTAQVDPPETAGPTIGGLG